jgi:hypothetical protein
MLIWIDFHGVKTTLSPLGRHGSESRDVSPVVLRIAQDAGWPALAPSSRCSGGCGAAASLRSGAQRTNQEQTIFLHVSFES